ncbi:MAG: 3-hydroxyacyl-ACP dehydratase FabZ family protein [Caldisericaceae bacterium]
MNTSTKTINCVKLSREEVRNILPQKDPFLFVDEVIDIVPGERVIGRKTFTGHEDFFKGHFPNMPVLPGVIMVELAAQVSSFMILVIPKYKNLFGFFAGVEKFRFLNKVIPEATLTVESKLIEFRHNVAKSACKIYSGDKLMAEGIVSAYFVDKSTL